jgi:hypothetical protein
LSTHVEEYIALSRLVNVGNHVPNRSRFIDVFRRLGGTVGRSALSLTVGRQGEPEEKCDCYRVGCLGAHRGMVTGVLQMGQEFSGSGDTVHELLEATLFCGLTVRQIGNTACVFTT